MDVVPRRAGHDRRFIVSEAANLADADGLACVTLVNLAQRLNVRPPSLYNYFASIAAMHHQLALFGLESLCDVLTRAAVGRNGPDGVFAVSSAYREYAKRRPGLYMATICVDKPSDDPEMQRVFDDILTVITAVLTPFDLGSEHMAHAARGLRSLLHGFVSLEVAGSFGLQQNVDESFRLNIATFISGLKGEFEPIRP